MIEVASLIATKPFSKLPSETPCLTESRLSTNRSINGCGEFIYVAAEALPRHQLVNPLFDDNLGMNCRWRFPIASAFCEGFEHPLIQMNATTSPATRQVVAAEAPKSPGS
jgi:hypothetical protein